MTTPVPTLTHRIGLLALGAATLLLGACASFEHVRDGQPQFPPADQATRPSGVRVNYDKLSTIVPGATKKQVYETIGAPHFSEGLLGETWWDYLLTVREAGATAGRECRLKIEWAERSKAADTRVKAVHYSDPACVTPPPVPERVVVKEVTHEVVREVAAPAKAAPLAAKASLMFGFDRSDAASILSVSGASYHALLEQIAQAGNKVGTLTIVGHGDPRGSAEYNRLLGLARARTVALMLRQDGVQADVVQVESRGEEQLAVQCAGPQRGSGKGDCHTPNRRVEVTAQGAARP